MRYSGKTVREKIISSPHGSRGILKNLKDFNNSKSNKKVSLKYFWLENNSIFHIMP